MGESHVRRANLPEVDRGVWASTGDATDVQVGCSVGGEDMDATIHSRCGASGPGGDSGDQLQHRLSTAAAALRDDPTGILADHNEPDRGIVGIDLTSQISNRTTCQQLDTE